MEKKWRQEEKEKEVEASIEASILCGGAIRQYLSKINKLLLRNIEIDGYRKKRLPNTWGPSKKTKIKKLWWVGTAGGLNCHYMSCAAFGEECN